MSGSKILSYAPINRCLNMVTQPHKGWVKMALGLPEGPSYPSTFLTQTIFLMCCPLNDRRIAVRNLFEVSRLFSLFLPFSCPSSPPDERQCSSYPWPRLSGTITSVLVIRRKLGVSAGVRVSAIILQSRVSKNFEK